MKRKGILVGLLVILLVLPLVSSTLNCCKWREEKGLYGCYELSSPEECEGVFVDLQETIIEDDSLAWLEVVRWSYVGIAIVGIIIILGIIAVKRM